MPTDLDDFNGLDLTANNIAKISEHSTGFVSLHDKVGDLVETATERTISDIFSILEAVQIDIDKEDTVCIVRPVDGGIPSYTKVIEGVNLKLETTSQPIRLETMAAYSTVKEEGPAWACIRHLRLKLRHVEIKDL